MLISRWLKSTLTPRLLPAPDAKQRRRRFPSNSTRDLEITFHIPRRASTVCSRRSCSTTCRPKKKGKTLRAIRRVLKPNGGFHMLDFEGPESGSKGVLFRL